MMTYTCIAIYMAFGTCFTKPYMFDETRQSVHANYMYAPTGNTCMHNAISKLHIAGKF